MTFTTARRDLSRHQKTAKGAPPYSRFVNRPLGRVLAAAASVTSANPNQLTLLSAACSAAGIAVIATIDPSGLSALTAVGLLILGYGLDSADGQLARLRGGGSPAGEWLDHTVDAAKIVTLHLAILISLYRFGDLGSDAWLLVPIGFAASATVLFFSWILRDYMLSDTAISTNRRADGSHHSIANSLMRALEDYGVLMLVLLTLPATELFVGLYTVLFGWSVLMVIVSLPRRFNAIESIGREGLS